MKKQIITDKELLVNILLGLTKDPISRDQWLDFVENTTYSPENTLLYLDIWKYTYTYHEICKTIGIASNIKDQQTIDVASVPGMQDYSFHDVKNEDDLKKWSEQICTKLIDKYIKSGAELEINISSKIRTECTSDPKNGKFHPNGFVSVKMSIFDNMVANDLTKFKAVALDQNIAIEHRRLRLLGGILMVGGIILMYSLLLSSNASQYYRLLGQPLTYYLFLFYFQYRAKFCVTFAGAKHRNVKGYTGILTEDEYTCQYQKKRAIKIKLKSHLGGTLLLILLFVVPPYNW